MISIRDCNGCEKSAARVVKGYSFCKGRKMPKIISGDCCYKKSGFYYVELLKIDRNVKLRVDLLFRSVKTTSLIPKVPKITEAIKLEQKIIHNYGHSLFTISFAMRI